MRSPSVKQSVKSGGSASSGRQLGRNSLTESAAAFKLTPDPKSQPH